MAYLPSCILMETFLDDLGNRLANHLNDTSPNILVAVPPDRLLEDDVYFPTACAADEWTCACACACVVYACDVRSFFVLVFFFSQLMSRVYIKIIIKRHLASKITKRLTIWPTTSLIWFTLGTGPAGTLRTRLKSSRPLLSATCLMFCSLTLPSQYCPGTLLFEIPLCTPQVFDRRGSLMGFCGLFNMVLRHTHQFTS